MKSLVESIQQQLVCESWEPTTDIKKWDIMLKAIKDATACANYSQTGLETLCIDDYKDEINKGDFEDALESYKDCFTNCYAAAVKAIGNEEEARRILCDIMKLIALNYKRDLYCYGEDDREIRNLKKSHTGKSTSVDYGVEEENCYAFYEFVGAPRLKKYARVIAEYSNCSADYDDEY